MLYYLNKNLSIQDCKDIDDLKLKAFDTALKQYKDDIKALKTIPEKEMYARECFPLLARILF